MKATGALLIAVVTGFSVNAEAGMTPASIIVNSINSIGFGRALNRANSPAGNFAVYKWSNAPSATKNKSINPMAN